MSSDVRVQVSPRALNFNGPSSGLFKFNAERLELLGVGPDRASLREPHSVLRRSGWGKSRLAQTSIPGCANTVRASCTRLSSHQRTLNDTPLPSRWKILILQKTHDCGIHNFVQLFWLHVKVPPRRQEPLGSAQTLGGVVVFNLCRSHATKEIEG